MCARVSLAVRAIFSCRLPERLTSIPLPEWSERDPLFHAGPRLPSAPNAAGGGRPSRWRVRADGGRTRAGPLVGHDHACPSFFPGCAPARVLGFGRHEPVPGLIPNFLTPL